MKNILIWLIRLYQKTPTHAHNLCRFTPTCSEYFIQALEEYGTVQGLNYGIKRILKCHPGGKYGYDPLIKKEKQ